VPAVALAGNMPGPFDQFARALAIGGCTSGGERLGQALLMRWDANRCTPNPEFTDTVRTRIFARRTLEAVDNLYLRMLWWAHKDRNSHSLIKSQRTG
jgi:hypothetical protein